MAHEKSSIHLVVEKSEIVLVKPSKPTPEVSLCLSTLDNNPFSEFFVETIFIYSPESNLVNQVKEDPAFLLQQALSHALVFYYPLAGKLRRKSDDNRLELNCTAEDGMPFVSATSECTLSSLNYLEDVGDEAYQLVHCYEPVQGSEGYHPMALQITKFSCGGIAVGLTQCHSVCDGVGTVQFYRAIVELATGRTQPSVIPVWERERLIHDSKDKLKEEDNQTLKMVEFLKASSCVATSPYIPTENMVQETFKITSKDIMKLKKIISEEKQITKEKDNKDVGEGVTTFEIIAALVWRARSRALKLNPDGATVLGITFGIRSIVEPPLPEGYYGNSIAKAYLAMTPKELSELPLSRVVRLIKDMKRVVLDKQYVSMVLGVVEARLKERESFQNYNAGLMTLTDWRNIGFRNDSFGGFLNLISLNPISFPYKYVILPASNAVPGSSGDLRLIVTLPRDAMAKFKKEITVRDFIRSKY